MSHDIATVTTVEHRTTLVCECGHEVFHPSREGAHQLHTTHIAIERARTSLRGGR